VRDIKGLLKLVVRLLGYPPVAELAMR
jgi:hypothetical protein